MNACQLKVVVEGLADAWIIRAVMDQEVVAKLRFFAAGGRTSLATVGRNILVHEGGPVLLVMDANTREQHLVKEMQSMAGVAMSGVMQPTLFDGGPWYRVFAFVPEIEVIFFEAPLAMEKLMGRRLSDEILKDGLLAPGATLAPILRNSEKEYQAFLDQLDAESLKALAAGKQFHGLRMTVESMLRPAACA